MEPLDFDRHHELAQFLRSRRERITPEDAGIPRGNRRRTPGLRRGEVAMLAGMSLEWYTYLEQGRDIQASSEVLESLARVLQLDNHERRHLYILASRQNPPEATPPLPSIHPNLQNVLDLLKSAPAYIIDERMNVVAWNQAFAAVYGDYQFLSERERNLVWITFTSSYFRQLKGDHWGKAALHCLAQFRAGYGRYIEDSWWSEQITELSKSSPEFTEMWKQQEVLYAPEGHKVIIHPIAGDMIFDYQAFQAVDSPNLQVVINTPVTNTETENKVKMLINKYAAEDLLLYMKESRP